MTATAMLTDPPASTNSTTSTAPTDTARPALFSSGRSAACVGAVALITLLAFEALAVAAAMPAVAAALQGIPLYALAFGGPLAASVPGMVLAGRWCDRFGALRATAWGLGIFGAGLLVAGLAPHMAVLVAGRVLQGLGSGMLGVTLYVGMGQVVPPALHPRLFSLFATAWVVPGLVGPTLAAWLVDHVGWRSVFLAVLAVLPLAAALLLPSFAKLPRPALPTSAGSPADVKDPRLGFAVLGALGALLLHGAAGSHWPLLATGLVTVWATAWRLLPAGSLRAAPGLPSVLALRGLLAAAFATAEVFMPLALTRDHGWTLLQAGWALSIGALFWSLGSGLQARLTEAAPRERGLRVGLALVTTGIACLAMGLTLPLSTTLTAVLTVTSWALSGLGVGLAFPILSVQLLKVSAATEQGRNASALQLADALTTTAALAAAGLLAQQTHGTTGVLALAALLAASATLLARRAFAGQGPGRTQPIS
jgi:MFS family permease